MYRFRDTNEIGLESDKLSINTIIDGVNLDYTLKPFTTLNVSGRSNISRSIDVGELNSSDNNPNYFKVKEKFLSSSIDSRTIEIEFKFKNEDLKNHEEFRQNAEDLIYYLNKEQVEIKFTDDLAYSYIGTCREISIPKEDRNSLICIAYYEVIDPFKYTEIKEIELINGSIFKLKDYKQYYEPLILSKDLMVTNSSNKLVMTNVSTGSKLILNGSYTAGQKIEVGDIEIRSKGRNITDNLDLNADWEDFYIHKGDKFSFENCKALVKFRGRML